MSTTPRTSSVLDEERRSLLWFLVPAMAVVVIAGLTWRGETDLGPVTSWNLSDRAARARTAREHHALAAYVRAQAAAMDSKLELHQVLKEEYAARADQMAMDVHYEQLIGAEQQLQQAYEDLAQDYERLAQIAGAAEPVTVASSDPSRRRLTSSSSRRCR